MGIACPACAGALSGRATAVKHTRATRVELHWCDRCREYRKAVAERDFDREDAFEDRSWGPILWDLGALPAEHPFAEAA